MSYSVTTGGEVYKEPWLGWKLLNPMYALLPYTPHAFLYYSARTKKRHTYYGLAGVPIRERENYDKLAAATFTSVDDLDEAIRRADEVYARAGTPTKESLDIAGKRFAEQQFVPSNAPSISEPTADSPAPEKKRRRRRKQTPEWALPVAVGGGALLLLLVLVPRRR